MKQLIIFLSLFFVSFGASSQQLTQVLVELKAENQWKLDQKLNHHYDENGFLSYTINQAWDHETNDWLNISKMSYKRNEAGASIENRREIWNKFIGHWVSNSKTTFRLDDQGRVIESTRYEWQQNEWFEVSTEHTGYNENDQVISKQTFNKNEDVWFLLNSYNYEYDEDGDISHYLFDSPSKKMRSVYTKDGKGKLTSVVREEYKNGVWQMYSKEEQHYHHALGLDFTIQKVWFSMTNEWTNNSKSSYLKDATGLIEQNIGYEWLEDEEHWNKISRRTYTYAVEQDESVQEPIAVSIYPNPTSNLITVDNIPEGLVTIITSFGKPVYRKKNKENQLKINVASFPNGYYFIRVNDKSIGNFVKAD